MAWIDLVVVGLVLVTLVVGFVSGFIRQVASLAGIVLGAIFAGTLSGFIAPWLIKVTDVSPHILGPLSYIIAFAAILVALFFAGKLLESVADALQLSFLNRLAGAFFCCVKWIVVFSILLNLIAEFDQNKQIIKEDVRESSYAYPLVSEIAKTVIPYLRFDWIK